MDLRPGTYVTAGKGVMALVDTSSLHVDGYFEETKLSRIHVGDPVHIHLMGDAAKLTGHVESVAAGIEDRDRAEGSNLLANVTPTFSWVRLAQRVPVRIALDPVPAGATLVAGRTATVEILPGNGTTVAKAKVTKRSSITLLSSPRRRGSINTVVSMITVGRSLHFSGEDGGYGSPPSRGRQ
jgi:multidrug resistance efflux pump